MEGDNNSIPKDYYKILEVDYDASEEKIRLNYRKLALVIGLMMLLQKWHPDKHKGDSAVTAKFQEINEAYNVLIDPDKHFEYDFTGIYEIDKYTLGKLCNRDMQEYLARFKGMILTCNGLGINQTSICHPKRWHSVRSGRLGLELFISTSVDDDTTTKGNK